MIRLHIEHISATFIAAFCHKVTIKLRKKAFSHVRFMFERNHNGLWFAISSHMQLIFEHFFRLDFPFQMVRRRKKNEKKNRNEKISPHIYLKSWNLIFSHD